MNDQMWANPFTQKHLDLLIADPFNVDVIMPINGKLMCNSIGVGAMEKVPNIIARVLSRVPPPEKLIINESDPLDNENVWKIPE